MTSNALMGSSGKAYESQLYNVNGLVNFRNLGASNPELIYKIKIGDFLPDSTYKNNFQFLYSTLNSKSISGYKSDWFISNDLVKALGDDLTNVNLRFSFISNFVKFNELSPLNPYAAQLTNYGLKATNLISLFLTQSKQVRVLNN